LRIICPGYGGKKRKGVNNELEIDENGYFDLANCRCWQRREIGIGYIESCTLQQECDNAGSGGW
jgi:hypothetical protein